MTYAELMVVVTLLTGAAIGGMGAASEQAAWWAVLLWALGGLVVGVVLGGVSLGFANWALTRASRHPQRLIRGALILSYFLIPMLSFAGVVLGTIWLIRFIF